MSPSFFEGDSMKTFGLAAAASALFATAALASGRVTIVSEQDASRAWTPTPEAKLVVAGYPRASNNPARDACITIGYMIDKEGKTSNFVAMNAWSSVIGEDKASPGLEPYVQNAAATVSLWRFAPVGKARQIYTSHSFAFAGSKTLAEEDIRARCRISDLQAFVDAAALDNPEQARLNAEKARIREEQRNRQREAAAAALN
jgi:hypothetical protein